MSAKNMTALFSLFARAYHAEHHQEHIFFDCCARKLISDEEYSEISNNLIRGSSFFLKDTEHTGDAVGLITDTVLSPAPLMRAAFAEAALENAVRLGAARYFILGSGYDTFALRKPQFSENIEIYELDLPEMIADKASRIDRSGLAPAENLFSVPVYLSSRNEIGELRNLLSANMNCPDFFSLLGLVHYLPRDMFSFLLNTISGNTARGSSIVFDYPGKDYLNSSQYSLARGAGQKMQSLYSYPEIESILEENNFLIYEHLSPEDAEARFFSDFNKCESCEMHAPHDTELILAVNQA